MATVPSSQGGGPGPDLDPDLDGARARGEAIVTNSARPTVEVLLAEGLNQAGASPVHLAIRGTPAATSVRCGWRGTARTTAQRDDAIRTWLQLSPTDAIPDVAYLEAFFAVVLDEFNPSLRETAKASFLAIARGGESMDYLFLTCFADYTVTAFLLGTGTTPATDIFFFRSKFLENEELFQFPGGNTTADRRDVRLNTCLAQSSAPYNGYETLVHEGGHALGLRGHPGLVKPAPFRDTALKPDKDRGCSPHPLDVLALYALYQSR